MDDETRLPTRGDVDWAVLAPLLAHVVITHVVVGVVRVTLSYRTVELGLPVVWPGILAAGFAILPVFFAVQIGRYIDRGHDAQAAWMGSAMVLVSCAALWAWPNSPGQLLAFTLLLGMGHMFLMAAQQTLVIRCGNERGRDTAFGHFMIAVSIGQGLGPFIVGWIGGGATVPPTAPLFIVGVVSAAVCMAVALALRPVPRGAHEGESMAVPIIALLRRPGMLAVLAASVVTVTSGELLVIYLPLLGVERQIDAGHIGMLLMTRSLSALVARIFYTRLIYRMGRLPLTLTSTFLASGAFMLMVVPSLTVMYAAAVLIGIGLGIAGTLTLSGIVEVAPPEARATAMTMRITGNRLSLVFVPFLAGLVAAATGVAGILFLIAASLSASAAGMALSRRKAPT
jgi:MFS family permease